MFQKHPLLNNLNICRQGVKYILAYRKRFMATTVAERKEEAYPTGGYGITICKSTYPRKCQLCKKHKSKYRRQCPMCHKIIAPGCWPILCWKDEYIRCRECDGVIRFLKFHRYSQQFGKHNPGRITYSTKPNMFTYLDLPVGIQIKILVFVLQPQDFICTRSEVNNLLSLSAYPCPF